MYAEIVSWDVANLISSLSSPAFRKPVVIASRRQAAFLNDVIPGHPLDRLTVITPPPGPLTWHDVRCALTGFPRDAGIIVAIGGGTTMDFAKIAASTVRDRGDHERLIPPSRATICRKLCFVPTTAGTGSEVTSFATVFHDQRKYSVSFPEALDEVSIVHDATILQTLAAGQVAISGLDALSQAVESYLSANSTEDSRLMALEVISAVIASLHEMIGTRSRASCVSMQRAAYLSGRCIEITRTNICHALSYPLTGIFGLPHGLACALTLAAAVDLIDEVAVIRHCKNVDPSDLKSRTARIAQLFAASTWGSLNIFVREALSLSKIGNRLSAFGIEERNFSTIVEAAHGSDRLATAPVDFDQDLLTAILKQSL